MRKRQATKRDVLADPIYNSKVVTKLVNHIMKDGKKGTAQKIIYNAFDIVKEKSERAQALAFRWLAQYARLRGGHSMAENLANEIIDASNGTGASVKKKDDTHKMAEANKAFAHYRW